jgi:hypothetical protein
LIDGERGLDNWNRIGDANWRSEGGAVVADKGKGGGVFLRCSDPAKVGSATCYEVNIWDIRPEPKYATGAIVDHAAVPVPLVHKAGGHWNTYEITAKGMQLTVKLNGVQTVSIHDGKHTSGPFALQYGAGVNSAQGGAIKWRKVQIRPL